MSGNSKIIRQRIRSVRNTKKITKAMELVSAAKMRRSVQKALNTRTYAWLAQELMEHLSRHRRSKAELLEVRMVRSILVIVISSNRGLCGSFNTNLFKKTQKMLREKDAFIAADVDVKILGIGKKSAGFAKKYGYPLVAVYDEFTDSPELESLLPLTKYVINEFTKKTFDKVLIAFTDYKSGFRQEAKFTQMLPLSKVDIEKMITGAGRENQPESNFEKNNSDVPIESYLYEPNLDTILEYVLPRLVEIQLYQAVLESLASEHSARMMAMRNASDSAGEMIEELNITYNKARQAAITQEIAEIAGGAAALS